MVQLGLQAGCSWDSVTEPVAQLYYVCHTYYVDTYYITELVVQKLERVRHQLG